MISIRRFACFLFVATSKPNIPAKVKRPPPATTKQDIFHASSSIGDLKADDPHAIMCKPPYRNPDRMIPEAPVRFLPTGETSEYCRNNESVKLSSLALSMQRSGSAVFSMRENAVS